MFPRVATSVIKVADVNMGPTAHLNLDETLALVVPRQPLPESVSAADGEAAHRGSVLAPHIVAWASCHRPPLPQPSSDTYCSPIRSARHPLLLPALVHSFWVSFLATCPLWRKRRGPSLATAPPVASNIGCSHFNGLGHAPLHVWVL